MYAWKCSLDKLRTSMMDDKDDIDQKMFTCLRMSYDYLESMDAKLCFLLCCFFPKDAQVPVEELVRHCMARRLLSQNPDTLEETRDIVRSIVNTLKTGCLLLDGENDDFVKMDDIVRDVAISIAKEERAFLVKHGVKEWPKTGTYEKYSAISLRSETIHELPDELVCPELLTLMLECSGGKSHPEHGTKIPDTFFRGTEKLMILELNKAMVLPLPSSLAKLMELQMLCLNECKLGDIAMLKDLKNKLEILGLRGLDIKALPLEVGELTRLRLLDMGDCNELKVIPNGVISKLHRLEELHFPPLFVNWNETTGCEDISKVGLAELMLLTRLSTIEICLPSLFKLPMDLCFPNLIRFNINVGQPLHEKSKYCSSQGVMRLIDICIGDENSNILECILGKPKWSIERGGLCSSRSFNNLTQLEFKDCKLKYLFSPSCARGLLQLQRLVIQGSDIMEAVIGNEGEKDEDMVENVINFGQLKTLDLHTLPCLISFYPWMKKATTESHSFAPTLSLFNEMVALPALQELYIETVSTITAIWDMHTFLVPKKAADASFTQLRIMSVSNCSNLVNVVQLKVAFPALEKLAIISVPTITDIWDNLLPTESFCLLKSLEVGDCEKLMNVVSSHMLPLLRNVENLKISYLQGMEMIVVLEKREEETEEPNNGDIILFPKLRKMKLEYLENLKGLCAYISEDQLYFNLQVTFPNLKELFILSVGTIMTIQERQTFQVPEKTANSSFSRLRINDTSTITRTQSLFNHEVGFPALEILSIISMPNITEIWDKNLLPSESFGLLKSLRICDCERLMNVVPSHMLPLVQNVENLIVDGCLAVEVIVVLEKREEETQEPTNMDVVVFPELRRMKLVQMRSLTGVCAYKSEDGRLDFDVQVVFPKLSMSFPDLLP